MTDLHKKVTELTDKTAALRPLHATKISPAPRILSAIEKGAELVATRELTAGRVSYKPGDIFNYRGLPVDRVCLLAEQGRLMVKSEYDDLQRYNAMFKMLGDLVTPAFLDLQKHEHLYQRALLPIAEIQAQLDAAKRKADHAREELDQAREKLAEILKSDDITEVFG